MRPRRLAHALLSLTAVLAVAVAAPRPARAEGDGARAAASRAHFDSGVALYDANPPDYAGALAEFKAAYRIKPSAGLKQNIALCYKALRRYPEALDALRELLDEGGASLTPEVRRAAERAIVDLSRLVARVRARVVVRGKVAEVPQAIVLVDGEVAPAREADGAFRLGSGTHVITARAPGFKDAIPQTLELAGGGEERVVDLELWPEGPIAVALLVVRVDPGAEVWVDGAFVGRGGWSGPVPAGEHVVKVLTADGQALSEVTSVAAGAKAEVTLVVPTTAPAPADLVRTPALARDYPWYVRGGATLTRESLRLAEPAGEASEGRSRAFVGPSFVLAVGRRLPIDLFAVEVYGEIGTLYAEYTNDGAAAATRARVDRWVVAPVLRASSRGRLRGFAGVGAGLVGQSIGVSVPRGGAAGGADVREASGISGLALADLGLAYGFGRVSVELAGLGEIHGVGAVRDGRGERFLLASPAVRLGGRAGVAFAF
ncbi:MAG: hypothetical protein JNL38_20245 [Myxococcales bacterium]|nr:hypothetical protein [Myxococcales bacterium]